MKRFACLVALCLFALPAFAQNTDIESLAGLTFNFRNPGARSLGMGGAFLGLADDATAAETNPAGLTILRQHRRRGRSGLGGWAMRAQGNLSLVAVVLSGLLLWIDGARFLPGLWLLLLGHNFFALGGLAFAPMRLAGVVYQIGGVAALVPGSRPLWAMAVATALGNFWIGWGIRRERARERESQAAGESAIGNS